MTNAVMEKEINEVDQVKSIRKYFAKLKLTDHERIAENELKNFLRINGFKCSMKSSYFIDNYGIRRYMKVLVATQKKSGKTIAIEVDRYSARVRSIQLLMNIKSDYKVIILRGENTFYKNGPIEVISVEIKGMSNKGREKKPVKLDEALQHIEKQRLSNASNFVDELEKQLYDAAYDHMIRVFKEYNTIPKFDGLAYKMKENHSTLFHFIDKSSAWKVLKQVHNEWREIVFG